tara:strand:- start:824 stop:1018 length:195 start_codon:yes stop_codon:yes gene_type:complete
MDSICIIYKVAKSVVNSFLLPRVMDVVFIHNLLITLRHETRIVPAFRLLHDKRKEEAMDCLLTA